MKPIASPLVIIDFEFKFIPPQNQGEFDVRNVFNDYELDIDFSIHSDEFIQVFIKTEINRGKNPKHGYSMFAETVCMFEFNKDISITEEARNAIEGFSTIYISLNSLRGYIQQATSSGPLGRYMLPSVDLNDLIKKKKEMLGESEAKEGPKQKKVKNKAK
jgi:hypothetical protein